MVEKNDWRLRGQERWLSGVRLFLGNFLQHTEEFDHAHCEFCWAKFMDPEYRSKLGYETPDDIQTEGYHTEDENRWVCKVCFDDFREMFDWVTVD